MNSNRNLQGDIGADILSVYPKLQKLDLSFTKFQGSIPPCPTPTQADVVDAAATQEDKDVNNNMARSSNSNHVAAVDTNGSNSATSSVVEPLGGGEYLASCDTLQELVLSNTLVSGSIPSEIAYMSKLSK